MVFVFDVRVDERSLPCGEIWCEFFVAVEIYDFLEWVVPVSFDGMMKVDFFFGKGRL